MSVVLAFSALALGLGCSEEPVGPRGAELRLVWEGPVVRVVGVEFAMEVEVVSVEGEELEASVRWGSTAPEVAAVDERGLVLPLSVGTVRMWAEGAGVADTVEFRVVAPVALRIETEWPGQLVGRERQLEAVLEDSAGAVIEGLEVLWFSSDSSLARVDSSGLVSGRERGEVLVTAREGQSGLTDRLFFQVAVPGDVKWRWVPEGEGFASYGGPGLSPDGTLYVMTRVGPLPQDGVLHAFDRLRQHVWSVVLADVAGNHPTVSADGQVIYAVGSEATFAVGRGGQILWAAPSLSEGSGIFRGAAVSGDGATVYAVDGAELRGLEASTGRVLWSSPPETLEEYLVPPTISPDGRVVFTKLSEFDIRAFDAVTGEVLWSTPDPSDAVDTRVFNNGPVLADGRLFSPLRFSLLELDPTTGAILWQSVRDNGWSEPAVGPDGNLYLNADRAAAMRPPPGGWLWRNEEVNPAPVWVGGPALAADGAVYFIASHGFYALDGATGAVLWRYPPDPAQDLWFYGAPLIAPDGTVYTYTGDTLFAFWEDAPPEPDSPWPMWRHDARRSGQAHR